MTTALPLDHNGLAAGLLATAERFAALIPHATDHGRQVRTAPEWNIAELIRHVAHLPEWWTQMSQSMARVATSPADMVTVNRDRLSERSSTDVATCAATLAEGIARFADIVRSAPPGIVPFHAGSRATVGQIAGVALGELEIHGHDLGRTIGQPWRINPDHAACAILGSVRAVGDRWVDPVAARGHTGRYEIRLRGGRGTLRLEFDDGRLTVDPPGDGRRPDARLSARPEAFLKVLYGRQNQWVPALTGAIVASGRRPWRALKLQPMFLPI